MTGPVAPLGQIQRLPLDAIRPYETNPRRMPTKAVEQTAKSIREFGWQQPIVVDADHVIIAGHTRYAAARALGLAEAPVIVADWLTPEQVRAYRVADNRSHDYTSWDYTLLTGELADVGDEFADVLDLADWDKLLTAFEDAGQGEAFTLPSATAMPSEGVTVTVEFATKEDADRAGPDLMKVPGVINVRQSVK